MKILLTGGSGFVGRNIKEQLGNKYHILAPSSSLLDIRNRDAVKKYVLTHKPDVIIHSAVRGGENVLEEILRMFDSMLYVLPFVKKIIHMGSGAEYGKQRDLIKIKETDFGKVIPADHYGLGKYVCSKLAENEPKILTLRLFGIYGKHEGHLYKFISNSIVKNLLGLPIKIKQDVVFDYLYVDDLICVLDYFLHNKNKYPAYNISTTKSARLSEIVSIINSISENKSKISIVNPGLNFQYTADNSRIMTEIKNLQLTPIKKGIEKLYSYYKKQIKNINKKDLIEDDFLKKAKIKKIRNK